MSVRLSLVPMLCQTERAVLVRLGHGRSLSLPTRPTGLGQGSEGRCISQQASVNLAAQRGQFRPHMITPNQTKYLKLGPF